MHPSAGDDLAQRAAQVDRLVLDAFAQAQPSVTVLAVGGYGRRELFPYSDVDLLLLVDTAPSGAAREAVSEFLRILWDAGLRVSQSVHTVSECCEIHEGNLELTIGLLDFRRLAGDAERHADLEHRFPKFLNAQSHAVANHLCRMTRGRHARYGETIYHLEPNVKEHPGGLRDLHVIHWLARLRNLPPEALDASRGFLFGVRSFLHGHFRRDNNLLGFEAQEAVSPDPANWMRGYYRHARTIHRAVTRMLELAETPAGGLLTQFRDWRSRLSNPDFTVSRERVLLREPSKLASDPGLLLRLTQFISRHGLRLAPDTERRIRALGESGAHPRFTWPELRALLDLPLCSAGLRALQDTEMLPAIVPEWSRIDCLVVRDFYHRYTVDEHTLVALRALEELPSAAGPQHRRFADLLSEIEALAPLRLALLLHDIGKGGGDGGHVAESVAIARRALARLEVPAGASDDVLFLIEHHLDLSSVMNARDLGDSATALHIALAAGTIERLKLLTLMTYADIAAVNPAALTPWRLDQLWRAYLAGYEELTRELNSERIHSPESLSPDLAAFVEGFPTRYLRTHSTDEIRAHAALLGDGMAAGAGVALERRNSAHAVTVVTRDRPFLLASISGVLAGFGMNILKAEAFANAGGMALETLTFADPHRTLDLNPPETERLRDAILRALRGELDVDRLLERRPKLAARPGPQRIQPSVAFNHGASETSTLIEIVAEDRPGLLYDLTRAIAAAGCNIEVVLVDTEAHKALDVFYVTLDGRKLSGAPEARLHDALLAACPAGT